MPKQSGDFERTEEEAKLLEMLAWCCFSLSFALSILLYSYRGLTSIISGDIFFTVFPLFYGAWCELEMRRIRSSIKSREGITEATKLITLIYWPFLRPFVTVKNWFSSPPEPSHEGSTEARDSTHETIGSAIESKPDIFVYRYERSADARVGTRGTIRSATEKSHESVSVNRSNPALGNKSNLFIDIPTAFFGCCFYLIAILGLIAIAIGFAIGLLAGFIWLVKFLWYHV